MAVNWQTKKGDPYMTIDFTVQIEFRTGDPNLSVEAFCQTNKHKSDKKKVPSGVQIVIVSNRH